MGRTGEDARKHKGAAKTGEILRFVPRAAGPRPRQARDLPLQSRLEGAPTKKGNNPATPDYLPIVGLSVDYHVEVRAAPVYEHQQALSARAFLYGFTDAFRL